MTLSELKVMISFNVK